MFEPPPPPKERAQEVWDAIQRALGAWGLYALLAQLLKGNRK